MTDLDTSLRHLIGLGERHGLVFYSLLRRRAGWAVQWFDESRCTRSEAAEAQLQGQAGAMRQRLREGLWIKAYHSTPERAINAERRRLA